MSPEKLQSATQIAEKPISRALTGQFSNLLLEGLNRLWEVHKVLPDPKSIRRIIDIP